MGLGNWDLCLRAQRRGQLPSFRSQFLAAMVQADPIAVI